MLKLVLIFSACMIMSAPLAFAQQKAPKTIPSTYYLERNEIQLSEAINKFRAKKGLGELQLSPSLSFVARTHLNDIRLYSKDQHGCNLNSWSDKGKWTPCCFNEKQKNLDLMSSKPSEIIGFRGKGFEIVIAARKGVSAKSLIDLWLSGTATNNFLLSAGSWVNRDWQSMGISIYNGFASIWLSEMPDRITDIPLQKEPVIKIPKSEAPLRTKNKVVVAQEAARPVAGTNLPDAKKHVASVTIPEPDVHASTTTLPEQQVKITPVSNPDLTIYAATTPNQDKGTSYFLVHSSYVLLKDAMKAIESLKGEGFQNLIMIDARGKYRVALGIYTTEAAAKIALRKNFPHFTQLKIYLF